MRHEVTMPDEDWRNLRFFAEKHRSCQPFFATRQEVAQVESDKISYLLDNLEIENNKSNYENIAEQAKSILSIPQQ